MDLPGQPGRSLTAYKALMERCWHNDPAERPTFEATVAAIDAMRSTEPVRKLSVLHVHVYL
jgi:hypothetical protein